VKLPRYQHGDCHGSAATDCDSTQTGRTEENGIQPGSFDRLYRTVGSNRFVRHRSYQRTGLAGCSLIYVCFCSISWKVDLWQATRNSCSGSQSNVALTLSNDEMLIYTPVVGVLLLILAISAYPFQPHSLLLMFNSVVILLFVAIAFWAFIGMNRDLALSSLNGTKPGEITWDKQFLVRVAFYGLIPLLALLGAQFPESVTQFISYILPATKSH